MAVVFEAGALAGAAAAGVAAGLLAGAVGATGVAAGAAVVDFAGVVAGATASGVGDAADVVDFFERAFFGVVELSAVAFLSAASAFEFFLLLFLAVLESLWL